jgi:hypothetical protein
MKVIVFLLGVLIVGQLAGCALPSSISHALTVTPQEQARNDQALAAY